VSNFWRAKWSQSSRPATPLISPHTPTATAIIQLGFRGYGYAFIYELN